MKRPHVIIERDAGALTSLLPQILALADSEKDALGFLPAKALEDAIGRGRLLAGVIDDRGSRSFAGYLRRRIPPVEVGTRLRTADASTEGSNTKQTGARSRIALAPAPLRGL